MKKALLSIMTASVMMAAPLASANNDFTYISTGLQFGKADNELFGDEKTESELGAFFDASWNFYDNLFASYSISYNSYDGESWTHKWSLNPNESYTETGKNYFSTTKQYYSLGYFIPMNGRFTPYVSLGYVDYKFSLYRYDVGSSSSAPATFYSETDTVGGAAGEVGTYIQIADNYKMKFSYNYASLKDNSTKVDINEFYFGNDYAFADNWSAVANISYRDISTLNANEISTQVGVKYSF